MVAKITIGKSISGVINYNEKKVKEGKAHFFHTENMPYETSNFPYQAKIDRFDEIVGKQPKVKSNAVHIALAFDKSEHIDQYTLREISDKYMEGIGFHKQPYLVYQHFDADHPHIHIVTTNLTEDRKRIDLHDIGRKKSEPIRKSLEQEFKLVVAEGRKSQQKERERILVADYSKAGTKARISAIVRDVSKNYAYASIAEFNTVLNRYGVNADEGTEGSKIKENKGLVYRLLSPEGEMYGHSIKASAIFESPTLKNIEGNFEKNKLRKVQNKEWVVSAIESIFQTYKYVDQETFSDLLKKRGIEPVFRKNKEGLTYGLQFINHNNKTVYKASEIGKKYSPTQLLPKLADFTATAKQEKAVNYALESIYRTAKRSVPAYFFESTLINALPNLELEKQLTKMLPDISPKTLKSMTGQFIEGKNQKLPEVILREQLALKERATGLLKFINVKPELTLKDKMIFLLSNNISFRQVGKDLLLSDDRGRGVDVKIPDINVQELFRTKENVDFVLTEKDKVPFTLTERKIFVELGKGNKIPEDYKFATAYKVSFPRMAKFSDTAHTAQLQKTLSSNYLNEVLPKLDPGNATSLIEGLTSRGLLVKRNTAGEFYVGYYRTSNDNYAKLPENLSTVLKNAGFDSSVENKINDLVYLKNGKHLSSRYDLVVKIRQYMDDEKNDHVRNLLDTLKDKNPELHKILKGASDTMFLEKDKTDPEFANKKKFDNLVSQTIFNAVVNYPAKMLNQNTNIGNQSIKIYVDGEVNKLMKSIKVQRVKEGKRL